MKISSFLLWATLFTLATTSCGENPYVHGQRIYEASCASCHMKDGSGLESLIPPLAQADYLMSHQSDIPCIIKHGISDTITVNGIIFSSPMEGVDLTDVEVTNVINYINNAWGNHQEEVSLQEVKQRLSECGR